MAAAISDTFGHGPERFSVFEPANSARLAAMKAAATSSASCRWLVPE